MKNSNSYWKSGEPFVWLSGVSICISLLLVLGMIGIILFNGLGFFWPSDVVTLSLKNGELVSGSLVAEEEIPARVQLKTGNRDIYGIDFRWIDESEIVSREYSPEIVVFERTEWGDFYGEIRELTDGNTVLAASPNAAIRMLENELPLVLDTLERVRGLEKTEVGSINIAQENIRLELRGLELSGVVSGAEVDALNQQLSQLSDDYLQVEQAIDSLRSSMTKRVKLVTTDGQEKELPLSAVTRVYQPNAMSTGQKIAFYGSKVWEFISTDPRESNTEGGVLPAIFGTVMLVFIMSIVVTPLGVLAAIYLREYAKQGPLVSLVRIAVNNLAGVPSIVYGVFGVGFFIYFVGGGIDRMFFEEALPTPTFGTGGILWASLTLALLTVPTVIVATEEGLASIPKSLREGSYALGATKFETTWRVVLPSLMPAILTGTILAVARAAGEVAPLMITGVVKLAPSLPVDSFWPYLHLDRKFMHLGFHIYDVGFQSPNVDASRPMVFMAALLLLVIVVLLNLGAIVVRNRLSKALQSSGI